MLKFKKGDKVKVTAGKDKGKDGVVEKVNSVKGTVLIPGVNLYKKHIKAQGQGVQGGIYDIPRPLPYGNIALICPSCKKATRVGFKIVKDEKVRVCKKCKKEILVKKEVKPKKVKKK